MSDTKRINCSTAILAAAEQQAVRELLWHSLRPLYDDQLHDEYSRFGSEATLSASSRYLPTEAGHVSAS